MAVAVDPKALQRVLRSEAGRNTILKLDIADRARPIAILKSWQVDPIEKLPPCGLLPHRDGRRDPRDGSDCGQGEARGVKVDAGILEIIMREIEVECLPGDIPERIEVDVTDLGIQRCASRFRSAGQAPRSRFSNAADQVVVHVISVKEEAAPTPVLRLRPKAKLLLLLLPSPKS